MPLTTAKAAELLGLSPGQMRRLTEQARIVGASFLGRDWVFEAPFDLPPALCAIFRPRYTPFFQA